MENRILFLIDTLNTGGAESSLLEILPRFKKYKPVVCHIYAGTELKDMYRQRGLEVISLNIPLPYNFRKAISAVTEVCRRINPCLIHSTLFRADMVARWVAPRLQIPLVNSLVNNSYHASRFEKAGIVMKLKLKTLQAVDAFTARKVELFISNSESIKYSNAIALGIPLERINVIYRGRSLKKFSPDDPSAIQTLKEELKIGNKKVLLNVSRLLERKGQLDMLRAFKQVLRDTPNTTLLIAGDGPFRKELDEEIRLLQLQDSVVMLGTRNDVPALLKLADAFVFPSHYEGLPGVLIEAMMARTPIVASGIPENMECVQEETAFIHRPGDVPDLARTIHILLDDPEEANARAEKAYRVAQHKFDIDAIAARYETVYDELLKA